MESILGPRDLWRIRILRNRRFNFSLFIFLFVYRLHFSSSEVQTIYIISIAVFHVFLKFGVDILESIW